MVCIEGGRHRPLSDTPSLVDHGNPEVPHDVRWTPLTPASKPRPNETDLLFADELEIQCAARRSATPQKNTDNHRLGSGVASKPPVDLALERIELIPILPIDQENARRFPVETTVSPSPRQVVAPNPEKLQSIDAIRPPGIEPYTAGHDPTAAEVHACPVRRHGGDCGVPRSDGWPGGPRVRMCLHRPRYRFTS